MYYQSIPPYYLRQRSEDANGPDTARLIKFTNELDVNKYTEISNWKLKIASSGPVDIPVSRSRNFAEEPTQFTRHVYDAAGDDGRADSHFDSFSGRWSARRRAPSEREVWLAEFPLY